MFNGTLENRYGFVTMAGISRSIRDLYMYNNDRYIYAY